MNPSIYKPRYVVLNIKAPESVTEALIEEIKQILKTRTMGALCKVQMTDTEKKRNVSRSFNFNR
jgi:RNA-binding protein YhbY